jgi:hypothetical protein
MTKEKFCSIRPFAYHLTSVENLSSIRVTGCLETAASILERASQAELTRKHRPRRVPVFLNGEGVWLQSQAPLYERNILFCQGWGLEDLLGRLNSLVFFWPGTDDGPNIYGKRHLESASWDASVAILRVSTAELLDANATLSPLFCRYNSGSPRYSHGLPSRPGYLCYFGRFQRNLLRRCGAHFLRQS